MRALRWLGHAIRTVLTDDGPWTTAVRRGCT
ncbi:putative protein OS=Tsukamurella paurometabola (strain ATCC 8368 / DSM / CCUG 35730 /CIP 100753 / JCM 10117 / KCTC 9821 / NBRC 16120 / NCIMB 702349/ NCTC 13040) OX=521096 GN=Tpau_3391 PE=4 SV=1 [Tsukamurella paurometabola]|uniref:Uncharacterized protein n=1 Tax=Tsukamurella paurometabola (strain ATCC 8368 / DSM 20162 / CCUG 35730 / CIP 100753 / JCM 10117 / KCTC 9821 / NBRC 16120 / NCIMB 702349 / NCTC 13040) TaxID=521096 RepID=D5UWH6_TSUPD|nr:hypothetical protein Tpau_3391 [Tsukamurella paurometabola DSM 20162]SUP37890.1 Uncharacterised protein [Tsukamurella paurometabola]